MMWVIPALLKSFLSSSSKPLRSPYKIPATRVLFGSTQSFWVKLLIFLLKEKMVDIILLFCLVAITFISPG